MSAQVTILQLPSAGAITGTESVPIVQNGVTVQTTTGAIAASPSQPYTYLTVNQTPQLANSRYFGATNGLLLNDGGAQGLFNITTTGALLSLVNSGTGFQVKTSSTALTGRSIAVSGVGLSISNGDGIAGDPTTSLAGQVLNLANLSANGLMTITTAGALSATSILGVADQTVVTNADGVSGSPTIGLASNPIIPGTGGVTVPSGTSVQRAGGNGAFRYNTNTNLFEGYMSGSWSSFITTAISGTVTSVNVVSANGFAGIVADPNTTPAITLTTSVTGLLKGNGSAMSAAVAGTDYLAPPSGTALLKAASGGALANAISGTDYAPATSGSSILYGNAGGFSNVTVGSGLSFSAGTLTATGGAVTQIVAGTNVTISPAGGTGAVTINASGGGTAPAGAQIYTALNYGGF